MKKGAIKKNESGVRYNNAVVIPLKIFSNKISNYRDRVNNAILDELNRYECSKFFTPLKYIIKGGKRIRSVLLVLAFESVGVQGADPLPAAAAIELMHIESLIHDDIIDETCTRREKPTFHIRYGYKAAILSADFVFSIILGLVARYNDPRIMQVMAFATSRMCEGELEEIEARLP